MTIYNWPNKLNAAGIEFDLLGQTVPGPVTLMQTRAVGSFDGGYWIATLADVPVVKRQRILQFRTLRALLQGGAHQVRVPVCDKVNAPYPASEGGSVATFSDTATFSDGSKFAQSVIVVEVATAAAVRSTRLEITLIAADTPLSGMYFSVGDHLYQIAAVLDEELASGVDVAWQIVPPLREAVAAGDHVEFENPVCRMTLLNEQQMNLMTQQGRAGVATMMFVESFEDE